MLPQRQSSRPPKPVQPNPNYDYDLELPPAHKLPPRPKSYGRCGADRDRLGEEYSCPPKRSAYEQFPSLPLCKLPGRIIDCLSGVCVLGVQWE